jgi:putative PIN family toxin of toxin-antitoxin system
VRGFVVDASTLLAGVVGRPEGTPALILPALIDSKFDALACPRLLAEVSRGLESRHFRARLEEGQAADIVAAISESTVHLRDPDNPEPVLRDPVDDYLVALARAGGAEAIITGDKNLLEHIGLDPPPAITRAACQLLGLIESAAESLGADPSPSKPKRQRTLDFCLFAPKYIAKSGKIRESYGPVDRSFFPAYD